MNKRLVFLLLFVLLPSPCVLAQTNTQRDGNWWREVGDIAKLDYVTGVFDGMELGRNFTSWGIYKVFCERDEQSDRGRARCLLQRLSQPQH